MADRPILFSAPMVRAILAGTKTQTRRLIKAARTEWIRVDQQPHSDFDGRLCYGWDGNVGHALRCHYGKPGGRLWVREAWRTVKEADDTPPRDLNPAHRIWYEADAHADHHGHQLGYGKLRPGMFMPRWASRITLEITGVRVERLGAISEADAIAEGIGTRRVSESDSRWINYMASDDAGKAEGTLGDPRHSFWSLWERINGRESWVANPWVWVLEFKRIKA